jgi:hypothetical protein
VEDRLFVPEDEDDEQEEEEETKQRSTPLALASISQSVPHSPKAVPVTLTSKVIAVSLSGLFQNNDLLPANAVFAEALVASIQSATNAINLRTLSLAAVHCLKSHKIGY